VARYHTALGSLREVLACLEVAAALGYLPDVDPALKRRFDQVLGTLVRFVGGHREQRPPGKHQVSSSLRASSS
jgi:hypothetical protein